MGKTDVIVEYRRFDGGSCRCSEQEQVRQKGKATHRRQAMCESVWWKLRGLKSLVKSLEE